MTVKKRRKFNEENYELEWRLERKITDVSLRVGGFEKQFVKYFGSVNDISIKAVFVAGCGGFYYEDGYLPQL